MAAPSTDQDTWVRRVLGIAFPTGEDGDDAPVDWDALIEELLVDAADPDEPSTEDETVAPPLRLPAEPLLPIWNDAKEAADEEITKLQRAFIADGDPGLRDIGEYGLHGITKGQTVALVAALTDIDRTRSPDRLPDAFAAVRNFRAFLASSPIVDALENNCLDTPMEMRPILDAALAELETKLRG